MIPIYISRVRELAARRLGDETMIMSARDSSLFNLNETASAIWHAADGITPLSEIVEQSIVQQYDVDRALALADATRLVEDLARLGILKLSTSPVEAYL